jgi:hypothetical protein
MPFPFHFFISYLFVFSCKLEMYHGNFLVSLNTWYLRQQMKKGLGFKVNPKDPTIINMFNRLKILNIIFC